MLDHELVGPKPSFMGVPVTCQQCQQKTKEQLYHCQPCKKYLCSACHELLAADTDEMELDAQPAGELSEGVLGELEVEQAKATLAKHGM